MRVWNSWDALEIQPYRHRLLDIRQSLSSLSSAPSPQSSVLSRNACLFTSIPTRLHLHSATMSLNSVEQENAHHATAGQRHKPHSSSPSKSHRPFNPSTKLPLSPIHYHPNIPHSTPNRHTSPARPRPQLRRRRPAVPADPSEAGSRGGQSRVSSMDRATEVLSQLHFDYSQTKPAGRQRSEKPHAATGSPHLSLEQRYEQWKRFWLSIEANEKGKQTPNEADESEAHINDRETERLLRWLAFSRQKAQAGRATEGSQQHTATAHDESQPACDTPPTRPVSPHSPTYYVNLARFLSTATTHRQRLHPRQNAHTAHTQPPQPRHRPAGEQVSERVQQDDSGKGQSEEKEQSAGGVEAGERVEIVIDCNDDQHVAQRYIHRPTPTTSHPPAANDSHTSSPQPPATSASAGGSDSASQSTSSPPIRASSTYSFTNLPREHIHPTASNAPKAAGASSFSLHAYFARMSVAQLQRYLQVFNPSLLSSSLALTKAQLISICCTFYRTRIASHRSQPLNQASEQIKQDTAKDAIIAHTNRTYAHLSLPALLQTITAATTLASAPAVLSGLGYVDERSVKSGYRRCMLRVHPDKHTLSGWEEQTRCVELFRLVQDKYAQWQRVNGTR